VGGKTMNRKHEMETHWNNVPLGQQMDHIVDKQQRIVETMKEIKGVLAGGAV